VGLTQAHPNKFLPPCDWLIDQFLLPSLFLRFTPEEKAKRPSVCHMPFGWGPRNCIGMRFALMEAKMALIEIVKKYTFVQVPETEVSLPLTPSDLLV